QTPASWTSLGYPQQGPFFSLALNGSTLYVGGPAGLYGLDAATGVMTGWSAATNSVVFALGATGSAVYAGGDFTTIGNQARKHLAALDPVTAQAFLWDPSLNGPVLALQAGASIFAGGEYTSAGGAPRARLAAIDAATGQVTAWNPGADGK